MNQRILKLIYTVANIKIKSLPNFVFVRNAVNLSYKLLGDTPTLPGAPPVFLLHGLLGRKRHWKGLGKTIMNVTKKSVISVDLRNHGNSPHVNSHKYEELARDMILLFKRMDVDRVSLVGHSMGGRTAMCLSLIAPEYVAGILIVDISPISTTSQLTDGFPKVLNAMREIKFQRQPSVSAARKEAKSKLSNVINDSLLMRTVLSNINVKRNGEIGWSCNLDVLIKEFKQIASFPYSMIHKKYSGPTLFIGGQLSEYLPADDLPGIREMFPQAVVKYVPKTGHSPHVEDTKTFLEHSIAFIRNLK